MIHQRLIVTDIDARPDGDAVVVSWTEELVQFHDNGLRWDGDGESRSPHRWETRFEPERKEERIPSQDDRSILPYLPGEVEREVWVVFRELRGQKAEKERKEAAQAMAQAGFLAVCRQRESSKFTFCNADGTPRRSMPDMPDWHGRGTYGNWKLSEEDSETFDYWDVRDSLTRKSVFTVVEGERGGDPCWVLAPGEAERILKEAV